MITIEKQQFGEIPILHVVNDKNRQSKIPVVIYYHGFYGKKQDSLTIAYNLAEKGLRVILPDSFMHGERNQGETKATIDLAFWDIVLQNVQDINKIKTNLEAAHLLDETTRLGVGGTSMGGITTAAALTVYEWIHSAAIVMGSPNLSKFATYIIDNYNHIATEKIPDDVIEETMAKIEPFDLSKYPEHIYNRPLMFWHGEEDIVVPTILSEQFYLHNIDLVTNKNALKYVKETKRAHHVSRLAVEEVTNWFTAHLIS